MVWAMLNGRLYRVAMLPLLLALVVAAFSLTSSSGPLRPGYAPEAFDGGQAYAELGQLVRRYPDRRPGSAGDQGLAGYVASTLREIGGGAARGGFVVRSVGVPAQTAEGERDLTTVIAERAGAGNGPPLVVIAHRDAIGTGAAAQLSGTAALLELARVLAHSETQRTIYLVSTSGGTGGDAGVRDFLARTAGPLDAAIVLGDLAGAGSRKPYVYPFSAAPGSAPLLLERTVAEAIAQQAGVDPGAPTALERLAHLAYPLTLGEQGRLLAAGVPAALVQVSGEAGPPASEPVSEDSLASIGRGVLSALYALDRGPDVAASAEGPLQRGLPAQRKLIPAWAFALVLGVLLLAPLVTLVDGLARMGREREPILRSLLWGLSCMVPFLVCGLVIVVLGSLGALGATPAGPIASSSTLGVGAWEAIAAVGLVLVLAWLAWAPVSRVVGVGPRPPSEGAGVPVLMVFELVAVLVWLVNPYASLLLLPALHLWLGALLLRRPMFSNNAQPLLAALLALLGLLPLGLELAYYASAFGMGPLELSHAVVMFVAAGGLGVWGLLAWSVALGCFVAILLALLLPVAEPEDEEPGEGDRLRDQLVPAIPRSLTYAGPGALGGPASSGRS
jgi:hypothetical protein